ncbi:MAG: fibronectin type III domain-containing protein [Spirochaetes bacterium]|nr:fibronectin type III domain-containing protein [Spirochaetota bacterium]
MFTTDHHICAYFLKFRLIIFLITIPFISQCTLFKFEYSEDLYNTDLNNYVVFKIKSNQFTFEWNQPDSQVPDYYKVYYKVHNSTDWIFLANSSTLSYIVHFDDLEEDQYDYNFGITAVYGSNESLLHHSLDGNADPSKGWYIRFNMN